MLRVVVTALVRATPSARRQPKCEQCAVRVFCVHYKAPVGARVRKFFAVDTYRSTLKKRIKMLHAVQQFISRGMGVVGEGYAHPNAFRDFKKTIEGAPPKAPQGTRILADTRKLRRSLFLMY